MSEPVTFGSNNPGTAKDKSDDQNIVTFNCSLNGAGGHGPEIKNSYYVNHQSLKPSDLLSNFNSVNKLHSNEEPISSKKEILDLQRFRSNMLHGCQLRFPLSS